MTTNQLLESVLADITVYSCIQTRKITVFRIAYQISETRILITMMNQVCHAKFLSVSEVTLIQYINGRLEETSSFHL